MRFRGFSLLEILIIVAVTGLVVGIAIPTWQAWELRGQVEQGVEKAVEQLQEVENFYRSRGRLPKHSGEVGMDARINHERVEYVTWRRSLQSPEQVGYVDVQMTLQPMGAGMTPIVLEARIADGNLRWRCMSARRLGEPEERTLADFYLPSRCRQGDEVAGP